MNLQKQVLRAGVQKKRKAAGLAFQSGRAGGGRKRGRWIQLKNILVLCDDFWHPGEIIERGFSLLEGEEFHFEFVRDAKDILTPAFISGFPVIVNCKGNNINGGNSNAWFEEGVTEVMPKDLRAYVEVGGGFVSIHSGNTFGPDRCPDYAEFVGNRFVTHPPRCEVEVRVEKEHPVTQGVRGFTERDEHYELADIAPDAEILLTTHSATGGDQVGGYVRSLGRGRLCALTPGHVLGVWENPEFQKLVKNALRWCMGE